ncbi:MAG: hypothetical protein AB1420_16800 [Bacillota bacterium]
MTIDIKLKSGFFKTQLYSLVIFQNQISLIPKENSELNKINIRPEDLISVNIFKRGSRVVELEIITKNGSYTGTIDTESNVEELLSTLKEIWQKTYYY